jgi:hypothetical protein
VETVISFQTLLLLVSAEKVEVGGRPVVALGGRAVILWAKVVVKVVRGATATMLRVVVAVRVGIQERGVEV